MESLAEGSNFRVRFSYTKRAETDFTNKECFPITYSLESPLPPLSEWDPLRAHITSTSQPLYDMQAKGPINFHC